MFKVIESRFLAPDVKKFKIVAPRIAKKQRIPLTIVDSDPKEGTITLIVQGVGKTTKAPFFCRKRDVSFLSPKPLL